MKYALDAAEDPALAPPARIVLISPMIGITRFARFAGFAGLPALLPPFAKASWLSVVPEFNPFKYNSFPVNGGRQSWRLTAALQDQILRLSRAGKLDGLPPILTFQSVLDFTVSTPAILSALYAHLPANGSEVVMFDVNRIVKFGPLLRASADNALARLTPAEPVAFAFTVIANAAPDTTRTVERSTPAGERAERVRPLDIEYPAQIFSLSHVAVPFPLDDPLYGLQPDPATADQYGVSLGAMSVRGERNALVVDQDFLTRIASNPFFPYMLARIEEWIAAPAAPAKAPVSAKRPAPQTGAPAAVPPPEPAHQPAVDP
jgi:alpha-beta hydrolase superfamily lysophospholipase